MKRSAALHGMLRKSTAPSSSPAERLCSRALSLEGGISTPRNTTSSRSGFRFASHVRFRESYGRARVRRHLLTLPSPPLGARANTYDVKEPEKFGRGVIGF